MTFKRRPTVEITFVYIFIINKCKAWILFVFTCCKRMNKVYRNLPENFWTKKNQSHFLYINNMLKMSQQKITKQKSLLLLIVILCWTFFYKYFILEIDFLFSVFFCSKFRVSCDYTLFILFQQVNINIFLNFFKFPR